VERVTPDTVHLLAQLIRHRRALLKVWEKWACKQEPCQMQREFLRIIEAERGELLDEEKRVSELEVEFPKIVDAVSK
jgi:hypothetical protein